MQDRDPASRRDPGHARHRWLLAIPAAAILLFVILPLLLVLHKGADAGAWAWMGERFARDTLAMAAKQAAFSTLLALGLGLSLAWLYHSRRIPGERLQLALHAAPFVMPVFVIVYGLQAILGPRGVLQDIAGGTDLLTWTGPLWAIVIAHAYYNYGFTARWMHAALQRRPRRLEDAARLLGAGPVSSLWRITVPALLPSLLAVALLVFLFCFASFGTVLLLGDGVVRTLETVLYEKYYTSEHGKAAVLGLVQLSLNAVLLALFFAARRKSLRVPPEARAANRPVRRAGLLLQLLAWFLVAAALAPMLLVLVGGFQVDGQWSLEPWRHLLSHPEGFDLPRALGLTVAYAVLSAALAFGLCACVAYGSLGLRPLARRALEGLASIPLAASSLLTAFGLLLAYGHSSAVAVLDWRGTFWLVLIAHAMLVLPFAARAVLPAFEARDRRLDDAAFLLGAPVHHVASRIHWPMMRAPILVAIGFALALSIGDLGASSLLSSTDTQGLSVWTLELGGSFDALERARSTALAGLLAVLTAASLLVVERAGRAAEEPL